MSLNNQPHSKATKNKINKNAILQRLIIAVFNLQFQAYQIIKNSNKVV